MFMDILTFLGLDYRFASLITLGILFCPSNQYIKNQINPMIRSHKTLLLKSKNINMFKMDLRTFW